VTQSEVERLMIKHQAQQLIHGHTHQVAKHTFDVSEESKVRFDVGDWFDNVSFVEAKQDSIKLIIHPIGYYQNSDNF
jgi:UDP-2,3-diacylglucosamine hydrolase